MDSSGSLPEAFCARMRGMLGDEEYAAFLSSYGRERLFSLRVNPLKCSRDRFLSLAAPADRRDMPLSPVPWEPDGFYYPASWRPGRLPWHEAGMYYIQEASAMAPAALCGARPGDRVLDLCAAPGGKAARLAADLRGEGVLVANEIHPGRARVLAANLERMGARNAIVANEAPERLSSRFPLFFDRILVDAPCSGEGMFRKEEEALRQWSPENVRMCADRQQEILEEAAAMLRPGGILVYSTCTFAPEEDEGAVARFLLSHPDFSLLPVLPQESAPGLDCGRPAWAARCLDDAADAERRAAVLGQIRLTARLWPHRLRGEGHFVALLQKKGGGREDLEGRDLAGRTGARAMEEKASEAWAGTGRRERGKGKGKGKGKPGGAQGKRGQKEEAGRREALQLWHAFCAEALAEGKKPGGDPMSIFPEDRILVSGHVLWALPLPSDALPLGGLRVLRPGLELGTLAGGRFTPAHALAMALVPGQARHVLDLAGASPEACAWLRGEAILSENTEMRGEKEFPARLQEAGPPRKGWILVCIDGCSAGWGKLSGGVVKNHYPKGLRKGSAYRPGQGCNAHTFCSRD